MAGQLTPTLALNASLADIDLADFKTFWPNIGPQGAISGTADLRGSLEAPLGQVSLRGSGLRAAFSSAGVPPAGFTLTAQLLGDHAVLDGTSMRDETCI